MWIKKNISSLLFVTLFVVGFLEMSFYFIYVYLPLERISGQNIGVPEDLPTISSILRPKLNIDNTVSLADTPKDFDFGRFEVFKNKLGVFNNKTEIVKAIDLSYVVSGKVSEIHRLSDKGSNYEYSLTLKNDLGQDLTENITKEEAVKSKISLISFSPNFNINEGNLDVIKPGDFLILKRIMSVVDSKDPDLIVIEVYLR